MTKASFQHEYYFDKMSSVWQGVHYAFVNVHRFAVY